MGTTNETEAHQLFARTQLARVITFTFSGDKEIGVINSKPI